MPLQLHFMNDLAQHLFMLCVKHASSSEPRPLVTESGRRWHRGFEVDLK